MARSDYINGNFASCLIDSSFDLDEALTFPANSSRQISELKSVVEEMPTVYSATDDVCSVCMDRFSADSGGKMVACGHVFHASCITSWLSNCNSCPLCRFDISGGLRS